MLERFTREARAAVVEAQEECRRAGATQVLPGHLLVALMHEPADSPSPAHDAHSRAAGVAADALERAGVRRDRARTVLARAAGAGDDATPLDPAVLSSVGIDLDAVRRQTESVFGAGALDAPASAPLGRARFAPPAKKALELALREAIALRSRSISDGHLLLGILRGEDASAIAVLRDAGADIGALRADVRSRLASDAA